MAIDPRQFSVPAAGAASQKNQNLVKRSQDLLRNTRSLSDIPNIVNNQVNATINLVTRRFPERLEQAGTNIVINTVTSAAMGVFQGFATGGIAGAITGGVSQGFNGAVGGVVGAVDQILAQTGSDVSLGVAGITDNIFGGALTGLANPVIANLKTISASGVFSALGDAGSNIAGLFGGDDFVSDEAVPPPAPPTTATEAGPVTNLESLGIGSAVLTSCPPEVKDQFNEMATVLAAEGAEIYAARQELVNRPDLSESDLPEIQAALDLKNAHTADVLAFQELVKQQAAECIPAEEQTFEHLPKHYASNLIPHHQPKFKFMFMVELVFHPEYQQLLSKSLLNKKSEFEFVVKNSSRPNVSFEYEEINMYNYWTRVPKRTLYEPMTMRFYDDDANSSNSFYTNYMRAMSPISNEGGGDTMIFPQQYQENSMSAKPISRPDEVTNQKGGASLGALNNDATNILTEIRLYQLYDWGRLLNVYHMYNPKITNMNLDDLDMADSGAGSELEIQFAYDGLYVEKSRKTTVELMAKLTGKMIGAGFEIDPIYDDDANDAKGEGTIESSFTDISLPERSSIAGAIDTPLQFAGAAEWTAANAPNVGTF